MNVLTNFIRSLVSGDKVRYQNKVSETNFDLDLTYITNRIIAMGIPGEGFAGVYRNHVETVADFFKKKHGEHFLIINLSEIPYDYRLFEEGEGAGKVIEKGFPDHHNPPVEFLVEICEEMDRFLKEDPRNVVSIHCLAGRGRTGTVIACYMTYSGMFESGTEALDYFATKRSTRERGVAQPSQRRYVQYVSELVSMFGQDTVNLKSLISDYFRKRGKQRLKSITMYTVPKYSDNGCCPVIEIYTAPTQFNPKKLLFSSLEKNPLRKYTQEDSIIEFNIDTVLSGDVYIRCYHHREKKKPKYMFRISFHVGMMPNRGILRLTKMEIDDALKSSKFDNDFFMDLTWEKVSSSDESLPISPTSPTQEFETDQFYNL